MTERLSFAEFVDIERCTPTDQEILEAFGPKKPRNQDLSPEEHLTGMGFHHERGKELALKANTVPAGMKGKQAGAWHNSHISLAKMHTRNRDRHLAHYLNKTKGRLSALKAMEVLK